MQWRVKRMKKKKSGDRDGYKRENSTRNNEKGVSLSGGFHFRRLSDRVIVVILYFCRSKSKSTGH